MIRVKLSNVLHLWHDGRSQSRKKMKKVNDIYAQTFYRYRTKAAMRYITHISFHACVKDVGVFDIIPVDLNRRDRHHERIDRFHGRFRVAYKQEKLYTF